MDTSIIGVALPDIQEELALYGAAAAAGGTAGVFLGGVLTDGLDWRWTLLINIPVAIAVLAATPALLPAGARRRERLDVVGSVLVTAALALAVFRDRRCRQCRLGLDPDGRGPGGRWR